MFALGVELRLHFFHPHKAFAESFLFAQDSVLNPRFFGRAFYFET